MRVRTAAGGTTMLVGALLLGVTACGGASNPPATTTTTAPTTSSTPASTMTTTPPKPTPTSAFEALGPVKLLRTHAAAGARAINAKNPMLPEFVATLRAGGAEALAPGLKSEIDKGYTYPGPNPFTPVNVTQTPTSADIDACWMATGAAIDPKTKAYVTPAVVNPMRYHLVVQNGAWIIWSTQKVTTFSCTNVPIVKEVW